MSGLGDQGRCERRSTVFVKIQKINWGGGGGGRSTRGGGGSGVRVDVNEELKFFVKILNKLGGGFGKGVRGGGVRVDVNVEVKFL